MNIPALITGHKAESAVIRRRLIVRGAVEGAVIQATGGTALIIGVSTAVDGAIGDTVDVIRSGLAMVTYGAEVTADQPLTSDADGRAIPATAGTFVIGYAEYDGEEDDVGSVWIAPGQLPAA
ncbi:capsid cement protein [Pectobacterium polaris]|uniref:capsid cement protein n=1 Tax=Pectobacterium polaris TaxID=2042057 RepID=UPI00158167BC|nr:capsid cement protein [Pectobacterium polaris]